jgi:hypothetical protein
MRNAFILAPALVGAALLLAGCSGEPSAGDIRKAVETKQEALAPLLGMMGAKVEITDLRKHKCAAIDGGRFRCSYAIAVKADSPMGGANEITQNLSAVFEDVGGGWVVVDN